MYKHLRLPRALGDPDLRADVARGTVAGRIAYRASGRTAPTILEWMRHSLAFTSGFSDGAQQARQVVASSVAKPRSTAVTSRRSAPSRS